MKTKSNYVGFAWNSAFRLSNAVWNFPFTIVVCVVVKQNLIFYFKFRNSAWKCTTVHSNRNCEFFHAISLYIVCFVLFFFLQLAVTACKGHVKKESTAAAPPPKTNRKSNLTFLISLHRHTLISTVPIWPCHTFSSPFLINPLSYSNCKSQAFNNTNRRRNCVFAYVFAVEAGNLLPKMIKKLHD